VPLCVVIQARHVKSVIDVETNRDWQLAELPVPPRPQGLGWLKAVGPGVIALGVSIGSGEFLLGPATFVQHGFSLLWVVLIAIVFQTIFNTEVMRYTLATGEPVFSGFMRTRPSSTLWAWVYVVLYFLQVGWPAWAGTAAAAMFYLVVQRLPDASADASTTYFIGVAAFLAVVVILSVGKRIEHTLEILNWILVTTSIGGFLILAVLFVPSQVWLAAGIGFTGFDLTQQRFDFFPAGADLVLLGALVAYSGSGGVTNLVLGNWARDRGYGMGERAGYIPAAGGPKVELAHVGFTFEPGDEAMERWRGWWRVVSVDQWGVFCAGAILGMMLPALLYVTFLPRGTDIQGLGISAALASAVGARAGTAVAIVIAFLGAWILFKTQLDNFEGMVRAVTDILWTGSRRVRAWRGGDVRKVYYTVLAVLVVWGIIALRLAQPIVLLKIGANVAGAVFVIAAPHLLYVNTRILPPHVRPPMWRRVALVAMAVFYALFVGLSIASVW
jgi:hypothetical protein